tara:strand:- start:991 stop:1326 length:336 start_codon:yes stop_codon:yes gene_type:complete
MTNSFNTDYQIEDKSNIIYEFTDINYNLEKEYNECKYEYDLLKNELYSKNIIINNLNEEILELNNTNKLLLHNKNMPQLLLTPPAINQNNKKIKNRRCIDVFSLFNNNMLK